MRVPKGILIFVTIKHTPTQRTRPAAPGLSFEAASEARPVSANFLQAAEDGWGNEGDARKVSECSNCEESAQRTSPLPIKCATLRSDLKRLIRHVFWINQFADQLAKRLMLGSIIPLGEKGSDIHLRRFSA
jgi:hypothetical protein